MLELSDVQGNIFTPYPHAHCARMLLCTVSDARAARAWLRELLPSLSLQGDSEKEEPHRVRINVGFTCSGLAALGLDPSELDGFAPAFREGMQRRKHLLGDCKQPLDHEPRWGDQPLHAVVLLYLDTASLEHVRPALREEGALTRDRHTCWSKHDGERLRSCLAARLDLAQRALGGVRGVELHAIDLHHPLVEPYGVEYFGFRDGVRNPDPVSENTCAEFVLDTPHDPLRHGGSYLVIRQLSQALDSFWREMEAQSQALGLEPEELAEQLMGRRQGGAPLDDSRADANPHVPAFDPKNAVSRCPFASHVRRVNPQVDTADGANPRIIRRGLSYVDGRGGRGLMFLAFNADIAAQFEFMQKNWVQRGNSASRRSSDYDVIAGSSLDLDARTTFTFSPGAREETRTFPSFVSLVEGEYVFVPSRRALSLIAAEPSPAGTRPLPDPSLCPITRLLQAPDENERRRLLQDWLDRPAWSRRFWSEVQKRSDGHADKLVPVGEYLFVSDPEAVRKVLANEQNLYTMHEYARRMAPVTGEFFLGMDECTSRYRRERKGADFLDGIEASKVSRSAEQAVLALFAEAAAVRALGDDPHAPVAVELATLLAFVLDAVAGEHFGLPGASSGSLATWGKELAEYIFRLLPTASEQAKAAMAGQQYRGHALRLCCASDEFPGADSRYARLRAFRAHIRAALAEGLPADREVSEDDVVRNLVGIVTGSLGATMKLFINGLCAHLRRQSSGQIAWPEVAEGESLYDLVLQPALEQAQVGGPDSLYRVRRSDGKLVVLWIGGAQGLDREIVFGHGSHKCPGMHIGKAMIDGMLRALRQRNGTFTGAPDALRFEFPA